MKIAFSVVLFCSDTYEAQTAESLSELLFSETTYTNTKLRSPTTSKSCWFLYLVVEPAHEPDSIHLSWQVAGVCNQMQLPACQDRNSESLWKMKHHSLRLKKLGQNVIFSDTCQILNYPDWRVLPSCQSSVSLLFFRREINHCWQVWTLWWQVIREVAHSHAEKWH